METSALLSLVAAVALVGNLHAYLIAPPVPVEKAEPGIRYNSFTPRPKVMCSPLATTEEHRSVFNVYIDESSATFVTRRTK